MPASYVPPVYTLPLTRAYNVVHWDFLRDSNTQNEIATFVTVTLDPLLCQFLATIYSKKSTSQSGSLVRSLSNTASSPKRGSAQYKSAWSHAEDAEAKAAAKPTPELKRSVQKDVNAKKPLPRQSGAFVPPTIPKGESFVDALTFLRAPSNTASRKDEKKDEKEGRDPWTFLRLSHQNQGKGKDKEREREGKENRSPREKKDKTKKDKTALEYLIGGKPSLGQSNASVKVASQGNAVEKRVLQKPVPHISDVAEPREDDVSSQFTFLGWVFFFH